MNKCFICLTEKEEDGFAELSSLKENAAEIIGNHLWFLKVLLVSITHSA